MQSLLHVTTILSIVLIVGSLFLKETHATRIWDEVSEGAPSC